MIELLQVRTLGADGSATVARTTLGIDGHVVMALHPELLDQPEVVARHVAEVEEQRRALGLRLRRIDRAIVLARRLGTVSLLLTGGASSLALATDAAEQAAWWAATAVLAGLARWLLPRLIRALGRRWLRRAARQLSSS